MAALVICAAMLISMVLAAPLCAAATSSNPGASGEYLCMHYSGELFEVVLHASLRYIPPAALCCVLTTHTCISVVFLQHRKPQHTIT
jgi:hypothetical protein